MTPRSYPPYPTSVAEVGLSFATYTIVIYASVWPSNGARGDVTRGVAILGDAVLFVVYGSDNFSNVKLLGSEFSLPSRPLFGEFCRGRGLFFYEFSLCLHWDAGVKCP